MTNNETAPPASLIVRDHSIETPDGVLFARSWQPMENINKSAPSFLLFHDSLGSVELWREFPQQLALKTGIAVFAYDRLGFGKSAVHPGKLAPTFINDEAATQVPRVIGTMRGVLGCNKIIPFGHSVGGGMAVAAAALHPSECTALITESAQTFLEDRTAEGIRAAKIAFQQPGQIERLAKYHGSKARWVLDAWIETWLSAEFANWTLDNDLRDVQCAMLSLHGDQDEFGSPEHLARIARLVKAPLRTVLLDGIGHVPHKEQPERVLNEISEFVHALR